MLLSPRKTPRALSKVPFKVLDAPDLAVSTPKIDVQDDFYLNLVDWSSTNTLAVGLASCVYLWSAQNSSVTKLCDLAEIGDSVTSIGWIQRVRKSTLFLHLLC
jgi:cell division cycle 20-like protein 1 (cofactor of APC complex)